MDREVMTNILHLSQTGVRTEADPAEDCLQPFEGGNELSIVLKTG
jgi:hypothetical protein